jgi:hypothetical protein
MKGILKAAVALALAATLLAPAAAPADRESANARAQERQYMSYGTPPALEPRTVAAEQDGPGAWRLIAIGAGALVLVLGAAELVTLGRLRAVRAA